MKKLTSIEDVLDIAIAGEIESRQLYIKMAAMVEEPFVRKTVERLAEEELQHRIKLTGVKAGKATLEHKDVGDLGIARTLEEVKPHAGMTYRELLVFAIKKEDISCKLYEKLAAVFSRAELKDLFSKLAEEEADHRRRFELQYEQMS